MEEQQAIKANENNSWKPSGFLAALLGLFLQPLAFLYVNRAGLFWFYLVVLFTSMIGTMFIPIESRFYFLYEFKLAPISIGIICATHAYLLAENYSDNIRRWYANGWAVLLTLIIYIAGTQLLRTFVVEPYVIPANSMAPTLKVGNHIVVSKWGYGNHRTMGIQFGNSVPTHFPARGNLFVFQYPQEPNIDYVKRIIGLPGDRIIYRNKQLFLQPKCAKTASQCPEMTPVELVLKETVQKDLRSISIFQETIGSSSYVVQHFDDRTDLSERYFQQHNTASDEWIVPEDHYFVLGDNRDNSNDSRYWGFVPSEFLVGKVLVHW